MEAKALTASRIGKNQPFKRSISQLVLVSAVMGLSLTALYMFNGIQEAVKAELHLTDFDLSLVEGVAVAIPLALSGIPVGLLVDRINRVKVMIAMTLLCVAAAVATAWSTTLPTLFVARVLAAAAGSALLTTAISLASDLSAIEHRGRAMQVVNLCKIVGSAAAFPVGALLVGYFSKHHDVEGWLGARAPWRSAHLALALLGSAFAVVLVFVREPQRHEVEAGIGAPVRVVLKELWMRRAYLAPLLLGQVGILMADAAATIWAAPILTRRFGLEPLQFASWLGLAGLIAGVVGSVAGGWAADAGQLKFRRGGVMLGAVLSSAIAIPAGLFPIMPGVTSCLGSLTVLLLCGTIASISLMAVIGTYLPNETRGLAFGGFLAVGGLVGFGVAPTLVVAVSTWLGGESHLAPALAAVGTAISVVAFGGFVIAMRMTPSISDNDVTSHIEDNEIS